MKLIGLNKGLSAIVDDEDFGFLSQWKWHVSSGGYAVRTLNNKGKFDKVFMHRILNRTQEGFDTDHVNREKLDNRKVNLRATTHSQNMLNMSLKINNKSGFRGVCWDKETQSWRAQLGFQNRRIRIGRFKTAEEASSAFKKELAKNA